LIEDDPLSGVTVFVAAARAKTFTQAAERLGLTKSAVGKSVMRLEERLGFKLFHRTTRLIRLTADGEAYLAACSAAVDEIKAAEAALASSNQVLSGRLRINMPVVFGRRIVLPILLRIARSNPELTLSLTFTDTTSDLLSQDVDLAVRFGALKDSSHLIGRHLVTQDRVICASPEYLRARGEPKTLDDVGAHHCVMGMGSVNGPPLYWAVMDQGHERRIHPPATHQMSDGEAMVEAAIAGLGLLQLPISVLREPIARGLLIPVLKELSSTAVDVHAVWPKQSHLSPRVRQVVDQLIVAAARGELD
jgi:DNA-binding transcriptional LysR family regulator